MDNLVNTYLEFRASNIEKYVRLVMKHFDSSVKLSIKLLDVIYDYLNEVYLPSEYASEAGLSRVTGLSLDKDRSSIIALMIDYGLVTRAKLKDEDVQSLYLFVVDTILLFVGIESKTISTEFNEGDFNKVLLEVLKEEKFEYDSRIGAIVDGYTNEFNKLFDTIYNKQNKFYLTILESPFSYKLLPFGDDMYYLNLEYYNQAFVDYEDKEVSNILNDYEFDIFKFGLEYMLIEFVDSLFKQEKKKVFINIPTRVFSKKTSFKVILDMVSIYSIKKNIVLNYEYSANKYESTVRLLFDKGFTTGIIKNVKFEKDFDLAYAKYLFFEYNDDNELKNIVKKTSESTKLVITNDVSVSEKLDCMGLGIKYFLSE